MLIEGIIFVDKEHITLFLGKNYPLILRPQKLNGLCAVHKIQPLLRRLKPFLSLSIKGGRFRALSLTQLAE